VSDPQFDAQQCAWHHQSLRSGPAGRCSTDRLRRVWSFATERTRTCRWMRPTRWICCRRMLWKARRGDVSAGVRRNVLSGTDLPGIGQLYGPRQSPHGAAGVIAVLGLAMITGGPSAVYRDGADAYDYVYVDDVVDAFVRAGAPTSTAATNAPRRSAGPRPPRSYSAKSNVNQSTTHDTSNYSTNSYFYSDRC
jgi:hypothetical protein